jgi:ParB/RepB/Spo0J family partition protein
MQETYIDAAVCSIQESPTNPRKHYDPAKMTELIASVKEHGIITPVVARYVRGSTDMLELVFGHRRLRAARAAKLDHIPTIIREMTDKAVLEAQLVENSQREDVHPLEEAEGYRQLKEVHDYTIEDIALKVGKDASYVYSRIKLLGLSDLGKQAFFDGKINASVALLVARMPSFELQDKALKDIVGEGDDEPMNVQEARRFITAHFMLRLVDAPFRKDDPTLVEAAGACTKCPKRTGNQKELFADVEAKDTCTDPKCFELKRGAHWEREKAKAKQEGRKVLSPVETKRLFPYNNGLMPHNSPYVALDERPIGEEADKPWKDILGKDTPKSVLVLDPLGNPRNLVLKADVLATEKVPEHILDSGALSTVVPTTRQQRAKERERLEQVQTMNDESIADLMSAIGGRGIQLEGFKMLLSSILESSHWASVLRDITRRRGLTTSKDLMPRDAVREYIERMTTIEECFGLLVEATVLHDLTGGVPLQSVELIEGFRKVYKNEAFGVVGTPPKASKKKSPKELFACGTVLPKAVKTVKILLSKVAAKPPKAKAKAKKKAKPASPKGKASKGKPKKP